MNIRIPFTSLGMTLYRSYGGGFIVQFGRVPRSTSLSRFDRWRAATYSSMTPGVAGWDRIAYFCHLLQLPGLKLELWALKKAGLARLDFHSQRAEEAKQHCRERQVLDFRITTEEEFARKREDQEALVERLRMEMGPIEEPPTTDAAFWHTHAAKSHAAGKDLPGPAATPWLTREAKNYAAGKYLPEPKDAP